jgi:hypothetical protein
MSPTQSDPWQRLGDTLSGRLEARTRGLLASEFVLLNSEGAEVGRLLIHGPAGADLEAGDAAARIERVGRSGYKMLSSGTEILTSAGDATSPKLVSHNRPYETSLSLLRNTAEAGPAQHKATIHIKGSLTNRAYEASFEPRDENSLPVALFLLYRLVALRRQAYRTK